METFKKEIGFRPAFDKRDPDPKKNYGIHGVELYFYLIGKLGAIQFVIYTGWHLRHVQNELDSKPVDREFPHLLCKPMPADIGYHSPKPMFEEQEPMSKKCHLLNGTCYYDGSGLQVEDVFTILLEKGSDGVWEEMERRYKETFNG